MCVCMFRERCLEHHVGSLGYLDKRHGLLAAETSVSAAGSPSQALRIPRLGNTSIPPPTLFVRVCIFVRSYSCAAASIATALLLAGSMSLVLACVSL